MDSIQKHSHTFMFRQAQQLKTAKSQLSKSKNLSQIKILSFGCSIGDEVATLSYYFPESKIYGCDTNRNVADFAQKSVGELGEIFYSSEAGISRRGPFDLIVVSAVLCMHPAPVNFKELFPVEKFDEYIDMIDSNLTNGGILILTNCSYRFCQTDKGADYTTIRSDIVTSNGFVNVYQRDGSLYLSQASTYGLDMPLLVRYGNEIPRDDEDIADSVFQKSDGGPNPKIVDLALAPLPPGITYLKSHCRTNIDGAAKAIDGRVVTWRQRFDFGRRSDDGRYGYATTISWQSFFSEAFHQRPAYWTDLP